MPETDRKISVVLAAYNGGRYLKEQLDSIAAQTLQPDEIIIRDDCSGDNSSEVIEQWAKDHPWLNITILDARQNLGYIENFRTLLNSAGGDWVFLSDQDDRWHPDKLKIMMDTVDQHPEALLVASSFSFMDSDSNVYQVPLRPGWSNNNLIPWQIEHVGGLNPVDETSMLAHNYFQGCAMAVSRPVIDDYLRTPLSSLAHDWYLALLASMKNGLYYLDRELFDYRIHQANVTGLPQAKGSSRIRTLKTWMNRYYRTVVVEDMLRVLNTLQQDFPEQFTQQLQQRQDFCRRYLRALEEKKFSDYLKLRKHPGRKPCMSDREYLVGAAFVFLSRFVALPDGKV